MAQRQFLLEVQLQLHTTFQDVSTWSNAVLAVCCDAHDAAGRGFLCTNWNIRNPGHTDELFKFTDCSKNGA
jgi:hypothetical protein